VSKDFRQIILAFGAQLFDVTILQAGKSLTFTLSDPNLLVFIVNEDAPRSIVASPLENHLISNLSACKIWTVGACETFNACLAD
jgi:hypothetical protein